ncbi:MAG: hypothetical protein HY807_06965 [Nitrospirae bacterium]|nr:hypothetical protein [Nitrospirota bacterium]
MIFKASDLDQAKFLSLSETGMGYQIIEARRYGKVNKESFVVYNSELIIDYDNQFSEFKRKTITEGYSIMLNKANKLSIETSSISLVPRSKITESRYFTESQNKAKSRESGGKGAAESSQETANGKELFVRLSAYKNDKRIDFVNNRLLPGTFTTTNLDYSLCVRLSDDPIDRYALPNDEQLKWAFSIQPKTTDILQRGIVQPAFGRNGGGVEAYFKNGTSNNTYSGTKPYGK